MGVLGVRKKKKKREEKKRVTPPRQATYRRIILYRLFHILHSRLLSNKFSTTSSILL